jgi:hypothetical protein
LSWLIVVFLTIAAVPRKEAMTVDQSRIRSFRAETNAESDGRKLPVFLEPG